MGEIENEKPSNLYRCILLYQLEVFKTSECSKTECVKVTWHVNGILVPQMISWPVQSCWKKFFKKPQYLLVIFSSDHVEIVMISQQSSFGFFIFELKKRVGACILNFLLESNVERKRLYLEKITSLTKVKSSVKSW